MKTKLICIKATFVKTFYAEVPEEFPELYIGEVEAVGDEINYTTGDVDTEPDGWNSSNISKAESSADLPIIRIDPEEAQLIIGISRS